MDEELLRADWITAWRGESWLHVHEQGASPIDIHIGAGAMSPVGIEETVLASETSDWLVVGYSGADGPHHGKATLYADAGVEVVGRSTGPGFLHRLDGFEGSMIWLRSAATVRATQGAHVTEPSSGTFVAGFFGGVDGSDLTIEGPSSRWAGADHYMIWSEGIGAHRFSLRDGVFAAQPCLTSMPGPVTCGVPDVRVFGASIKVP